MAKHLLLLILFSWAGIVQAQLTIDNSDARWATFRWQQDTPRIAPGDTCVVFVSNRHIYPDSLRFADEFVDTCSLKYFLLQKQPEGWKVYRTPSLDAAMSMLPEKRDIVLYAEGMGKIFTSNVFRALLMTRQYNVNVVMFDYASINTTYKPSRNFRFARSNASLSARQYYALLEEFQQARKEKQEWLSDVRLSAFYHSMGNIILMDMMKSLPYERLNAYPFINNLIINAACVPEGKHAGWVENIRFADKVYIHFNRTDMQLKGAHLITFTSQLGEKAKGPLAHNASYINFHSLVGWKHSYFLNFPHREFRLPETVTRYFTDLFKGLPASLVPVPASVLRPDYSAQKKSKEQLLGI